MLEDKEFSTEGFTYGRSNTISCVDELRRGPRLVKIQPKVDTFRRESSVTKKSCNVNSMQKAMSFVLLIAQCFALFPVRGITSDQAEDIKFTWRSFRMAYGIFAMLAMIHNILFVIVWLTKVGFNFKTAEALVFYCNALLCNIMFIRIAQRWSEAAILWQKTENSQIHYGYPKNLRSKIRRVFCIMLTVAFIEHLLSHLYLVDLCSICAKGNLDLLKRYLIMYHKPVFDLIPMNPYNAAFTIFGNIVGAFYWSFPDLFIMMVSISLASRFRLLNNHLKRTRGKVKDDKFWTSVREDYAALSFLTKSLDSCISSVILLSFATSLFYICQQLLYSMNETYSKVHEAYVFVSFLYLICRTIAKAMCAASVYEESQEAKYTLYSVPSESYSMEVHRFLDQVTTDCVALSGMNFFPVTRTVLLTLAGTIVTYEIVLVQFGTLTSLPENINVTELCLNVTRGNIY